MASSSIQTNVPGTLEFVPVWDPANGSMVTTTPPNPANFSFEVDGVSRAIQSMSYPGGNAMQVNAVGAAAVSEMRLFFNVEDSNVLNTDGITALPPQQIHSDV